MLEDTILDALRPLPSPAGALMKDKASGNMFNGVLLKWSEPPEARIPTLNWRLHVFKGDTQLGACWGPLLSLPLGAHSPRSLGP